MSKSYINARFNKKTETVDEFNSFNEARKMLKEYQLSDIGHTYWISARSTDEWRNDTKESEFEQRISALESAENTRQIEKNFEILENGIGSSVSYKNDIWGEL